VVVPGAPIALALVNLAKKDVWTVEITLISGITRPTVRLTRSCKERTWWGPASRVAAMDSQRLELDRLETAAWSNRAPPHESPIAIERCGQIVPCVVVAVSAGPDAGREQPEGG
jgi:hypothetical protein